MRKYFVLCALFFFGLAITGAGYEPAKTDIKSEQVSVEKVLTTVDYQKMVDQVAIGEEITFFIPPHEKAKLHGICCEPPSSPCQGYCCWRCPDPGKGG